MIIFEKSVKQRAINKKILYLHINKKIINKSPQTLEEMAKHYINQDYPVYISYAWKNKDYPGIETDVDNLCQALEDNGIFYERDKKAGNPLCPYRYSISECEEKIGQGCAVIMFISEKSIKSLHCMHEWKCIKDRGDIKNRVFPVVLEDAELTNPNKFKEYYHYFEQLKQDLVNQLLEGIVPLTDAQSKALYNRVYTSDLQDLYQFLSDYNKSSLKIIRNNNYSVIIEQLTEHLNNIVPKSTKEILNPSVNTRSQKWPFVAAAVVLLALLTYWIVPKLTQIPKSNSTNTTTEDVVGNDTPDIIWSTSPQWPYGKWTGGTKDGKPHGDNVTVIYLTNCVYNPKDPLKRVSNPGQKVVGYFEDGNLIIGDIYDENENLIERNFEPKL